MDPQALFNIPYGLFLLSAKEGDCDNACIINTAMQVTDTPFQLVIAVNKLHLTHDMIQRTKKFNLSILTQKTPFEVFQHFGFQSGRTTPKCLDRVYPRAENGLIYLDTWANTLLSGEVISTMDMGTHTLFLASLPVAEILSTDETLTYSYYQQMIRKKTPKLHKKGFRCRVCGYIYEGETLPDDFICPICKHGAADFEEIA